MPQLDPTHPLAKLLNRDKRYKFDAYVFVFEALNFAHEVLGMGQERPQEDDESETPPPKSKRKAARHLTGQQLCEAIRQYALDQFGLMAKSVLASWGVRTTTDFGNIVFNLIEAGQMRKTKQDSIDDFADVFDFDEAFIRDFKITPPPVSTE
jgi:uncharacterized repeat protein (TIGR04138 family)